MQSKLHPRTGHESPEGEQRYSSTLPSTSSLDGVGGQRHAPDVSPLGMTRYPLYKSLGGPQGRSRRLRKISPHWESIPGPYSPQRVAIPTALSRPTEQVHKLFKISPPCSTHMAIIRTQKSVSLERECNLCNGTFSTPGIFHIASQRPRCEVCSRFQCSNKQTNLFY